MQPNFVKVEVRCGSKGTTMPLCVRVDRGVPPQLRCTPSGGGRGSSVSSPRPCPGCAALLADGGNRLTEKVQQLVARGWNTHLRSGAVLINC
jgi:hypothetical protein